MWGFIKSLVSVWIMMGCVFEELSCVVCPNYWTKQFLVLFLGSTGIMRRWYKKWGGNPNIGDEKKMKGDEKGVRRKEMEDI